MPIGDNAPYTSLDQNQIFQRVFNETGDRLRVDAVSAQVGTFEAVIAANSGDNIAIASQDGTKTLSINPDGSINVVLSSTVAEIVTFQYNEITSLAPGVTSPILSFTGTKIKVLGVSVAGTNIATYEVLKNAAVVSKLYTTLTELNNEFNLSGLIVNAADTISVRVYHNRPSNGDFNATIKYVVV